MTVDTASKNSLTPRDILRFKDVSDPQVSPDGNKVAWVMKEVIAQTNSYRSTIWITSLETGDAYSLVEGTDPRWSPDGQALAYVGKAAFPSIQKNPPAAESVVDGSAQLFVIDPDGGTPIMLTDLRGGIGSPSWSPNGDGLIFLTYVRPDLGLEHLLEPDVTEEDLYFKFNRDVLVTDHMRWKFDGIGYFGNYRSHVGWVPFSAARPGMTELLTLGEFDLYSPTWSPDGSQLAVVGNTDPRAHSLRRLFIFLLDMKETAPLALRPLYHLEDMRSTALSWSPDGTHIAACGHQNAELGHYGNQQLWVINTETGEGNCLTEDLDRTTQNPTWSPDGSEILLLISDRAAINLWRLTQDGSRKEPLTSGVQVVSQYQLRPGTKGIVCLISDEATPPDLFWVDQESEQVKRLTNPNQKLLEQVELSRPQKFEFDSEGVTVDGWVMPALGLTAGQKAPAILTAGGGPGGMRGPEFSFQNQVLAGQGWSVIIINTRGCQGYGESFCTAILGDWGGADFVDNMNGLEAACDTFDFIDPDRIGAAGGSYGGYTVNWIMGNSDRIRAAVSECSIMNRYSSYGTSDIMPAREFEFGGGPPWETPKAYLAQSPLRHVGNFNTPTLVIHSALDHRCPVEQGEQLYMALKRMGIPTKFVRFSNESHGLSRYGKPWHRVFRLDQYLAWFKRWL